MRSRSSSPRCRLALVCLGLLLGAGPGASRADDPPPPGAILGTVLRDIDGAPVAFANVLETTRRIGTTTDDQGRFLLGGLPAGRVALKIQALGGPPLFETFDLAPGDTLRRTYRLAAPAHERYLHVRDSLTAEGRWPPTLDADLDRHMREALDVRVFRLDPERAIEGGKADPERRIGPWPIVGEARPPARPLTDALIETLRHSELYIPKIRGEKKLCGGFSPGIDVRFVSTGVAVDVLLCYRCGEFAIWRDGKGRQSGDFMGYGAEFVRFAQRVFPRDKEIKKLSARAEGPPR
jgi:hypothetical protein